jgi:hypothetical protein
MVTWLHVSGPVVRQDIMAERHGGGKLPGSRERQEEARDKIYPSKACAPLTCFFLLVIVHSV